MLLNSFCILPYEVMVTAYSISVFTPIVYRYIRSTYSELVHVNVAAAAHHQAVDRHGNDECD